MLRVGRVVRFVVMFGSLPPITRGYQPAYASEEDDAEEHQNELVGLNGRDVEGRLFRHEKPHDRNRYQPRADPEDQREESHEDDDSKKGAAGTSPCEERTDSRGLSFAGRGLLLDGEATNAGDLLGRGDLLVGVGQVLAELHGSRDCCSAGFLVAFAVVLAIVVDLLGLLVALGASLRIHDRVEAFSNVREVLVHDGRGDGRGGGIRRRPHRYGRCAHKCESFP